MLKMVHYMASRRNACLSKLGMIFFYLHPSSPFTSFGHPVYVFISYPILSVGTMN
jgi:hypothetical protein